ncbi:peptidoglycan D,D-transpeptidase FtsI family protein [Croceicoccus naphthovorans]|uniref:peptidoglycan D,D-transpeptidase FtsI family protein n=1 Tax=Croceicoccus naphthovorans TaxID=1348774 RepID=UPI0009E44CAE|nr:penicillin-binding protein 2 [Croceicoccus naphthovorans]MBB3988954.1 cell division protein FtsI (penicillin-binding protein 3) [Croceicoccus naphthovorans]
MASIPLGTAQGLTGPGARSAGLRHAPPPAPARRAGLRASTLSLARKRVALIAFVFTLATAVLVLRVAMIGVFGGTGSLTPAGDALLPDRGTIVDRNGVPLARDFKSYALWFNPKAMEGGDPLTRSPREVAQKLVAIFPDMDEADLEKKLASGKGQYLRRRILPEEANRVFQIGEPALSPPAEPSRYYPEGNLAAHVLGYVGADGKGRVGMEEVYNQQLTDAATRGGEQVLAIDARVQAALEDELMRGMGLAQAEGAGGIVLDVDTGEVIALASLPSFDPNHIDEAGMKLMFNRVTNQVYELGSTFKPLTVAAAIDAGTITNLGRTYPAGRPLQVGRFRIRDSHTIGQNINVPEVLIHSSNIGTAQIADELGSKRMKAKMELLGFNERPYIELPARGFPIWRSGEWPRLTTMTVSYGHGIAVTPLHLASAYAAMVNGGIWRPATLRKLSEDQVPKGRRVFKEATSARMRQLLRMIVTDGTGRKAEAPGFRIGGKTGSAEKPVDGGYKRTALVTTFASAFPMDNPRYVVVTMFDEPKGTAATSYQRTAAWNAAAAVGRIVPRIGPMLGVYPDENRDIDLTDVRPLIEHGGAH